MQTKGFFQNNSGIIITLSFDSINFVFLIIGIVEIMGGLLIIIGLFSRITSVILAGEMFVAILLTKVTLYWGMSPLPPPCVPPIHGIWAFLHEVRTDYALLITPLFIAIEGQEKSLLITGEKEIFNHL